MGTRAQESCTHKCLIHFVKYKNAHKEKGCELIFTLQKIKNKKPTTTISEALASIGEGRKCGWLGEGTRGKHPAGHPQLN